MGVDATNSGKTLNQSVGSLSPPPAWREDCLGMQAEIPRHSVHESWLVLSRARKAKAALGPKEEKTTSQAESEREKEKKGSYDSAHFQSVQIYFLNLHLGEVAFAPVDSQSGAGAQGSRGITKRREKKSTMVRFAFSSGFVAYLLPIIGTLLHYRLNARPAASQRPASSGARTAAPRHGGRR